MTQAGNISQVLLAAGEVRYNDPEAFSALYRTHSPAVMRFAQHMTGDAAAAAHGTRITITVPAGTAGNDHDLKIVNGRWVSDDLKLLVKSSNSDPRFGMTSYELTNIVQVPADYTEGH